uniref:THAP-type domain-containing protein n=1 Tax=Bombyx mori TaxID=7091 RepID=A0A8R2M2E1_BOMMO|nr:uncharacterized protein LOC101736623 isoform X3 [Bombyx mori]
MPRRCAFGCESINITMHRLPNRIRNPDLFKTWVKLVGGKLESISDYEHYQKKRICDIHFIDSDRNQHNRLNAKAFPSLHIPKISNDNSAVQYLLMEHNYAETSKSRGKPRIDSVRSSIIQPQLDINFEQIHNNVLSCSNNDMKQSHKNFKNKLTLPEQSITPKEDTKRHKLELTTGTSHTSYSADRTDLMVAITTDKSNYISEENSELVQKLLHKAILDFCDGDRPVHPFPSFQIKPTYSEGVLKLWCLDKFTLAWLTKAVSDITLPADVKPIVKKLSDLPTFIRCRILIPGTWEDKDMVFRVLMNQNHWAQINRWRTYRYLPQKGVALCVVGVPDDVIPRLLEAGRRLSFMLGSVYVKLNTGIRKFIRTLPKSNNSVVDSPIDESTTSTITLEEVSSTSNMIEPRVTIGFIRPTTEPIELDMELPSVLLSESNDVEVEEVA